MPFPIEGVQRMNKNLIRSAVFTMISANFLMGSFSQAAFQSQTLMRFGNSGMILTLPAQTAPEYNIYTPGKKDPIKILDAALLYDKRNPLPSLLMVGANYAFFAGGVMATVSEDGSLFYKGKTSYTPGALGGNYFLNSGTDEVIAIDSAGYYVATGILGKNIRLLGGNFFIDGSGVLTTLKHMGAVAGSPLGMVTVKDGWNFSDVVRAGGNFMVKVDGSIIGINSENGFFTEPQAIASPVKQIGGNYFITEDKTLYTVTDQGVVRKNLPIIGEMKTYGYSYMIDGDGDFIFVDGKGIPHTQLIRVSTTGIKSEVIQQIKESLSVQQNFIPSRQ